MILKNIAEVFAPNMLIMLVTLAFGLTYPLPVQFSMAVRQEAETLI